MSTDEPMRPRKSLPRRSPLPARTSRIRPKKKRTAAEEREKFSREFGSVERIQWVKSQRCVVNLLCLGRMENMHTKGDGAQRRGPYTSIIPACKRHHDESHRGQETFARRWGLDLAALAAETERAFRAFCGDEP